MRKRDASRFATPLRRRRTSAPSARTSPKANGCCVRSEDSAAAGRGTCWPRSVVRRALRSSPARSLVITGDELLARGQRPECAHRRQQLRCAARPGRARRRRGLALRASSPTIPEKIAECDERRASADVVLVSGGSSVGQEDHAPRLLSELGTLDYHGISMRPSSPSGCRAHLRRSGDRFVFLLPGNPVSCLCAYEFFAGPVVRTLGGRSRAWPQRQGNAAARAQDRVRDRPHRLRARRNRGRASDPTRHVGSVDPVVHGSRRRSCRRSARSRGNARRRCRRGAALRRRRSGANEAEPVPRCDRPRRSRGAVARGHRCEPPPAGSGRRSKHAHGRVLADDVRAEVDVPGFDRSNMDGFAVRAVDTFGATEEEPVRLLRNDEDHHDGDGAFDRGRPGARRRRSRPEACCPAARMPSSRSSTPTSKRRMAARPTVVVRNSRVPGAAVSFAGTDMGRGRDGLVRRDATDLPRDRSSCRDRM